MFRTCSYIMYLSIGRTAARLVVPAAVTALARTAGHTGGGHGMDP